MCPGRAVESAIERDEHLRGVLLSGLYQHEYRKIDEAFPYQEMTLEQLGIPERDVLHVSADEREYYLEIDVK